MVPIFQTIRIIRNLYRLDHNSTLDIEILEIIQRYFDEMVVILLEINAAIHESDEQHSADETVEANYKIILKQ